MRRIASYDFNKLYTHIFLVVTDDKKEMGNSSYKSIVYISHVQAQLFIYLYCLSTFYHSITRNLKYEIVHSRA